MQLPSLNPSLTKYDNDDLLGLIDLATLTFEICIPEYMQMSGTFADWSIGDAQWYFDRLGHEFVIDGDRQRIWSVH